MNTTLRTDLTINDICDGFIYNELEGKGLFGLFGNFDNSQITKIVNCDFNNLT